MADTDCKNDKAPKTEVQGSEFSTASTVDDPNIVDWDGSLDPHNPLNWSKWRKWGIILCASGLAFLDAVGSSMSATAVPDLIDQFGHDNGDSTVVTLIVSVYLLGLALGPTVVAPLSEMYGRLWLYHACNLLFLVFNVACALSTNLGMLIVFRLLAGCASVAPTTLGAGTIADLMPVDKRATATGVWAAGAIVGPILGPISGGFLSQAAGWRWVFSTITIAAGVVVVPCLLLMKETYSPIILKRKTEQLKAQTGNSALRSALDSDYDMAPRKAFRTSIVRPLVMLLTSPIVFLLSLYSAVALSYMYILITTFSEVYIERYGFTMGTSGLTFLGMGIGAIVGQAFYTILSNKAVRLHTARGDYNPEHRLPLMFVGSLMMPVGLFWYGWSAEKRGHWIVPIIGASPMGFGAMIIMSAPITYLIDVYTLHAASAMAAVIFLRALFGAFIPLVAFPLYRSLGLGWGNSLLGFVALALAPIPLFFVEYGERLRARYSGPATKWGEGSTTSSE